MADAKINKPVDVMWWAHRLILVGLLAASGYAFYHRSKDISITVPAKNLAANHVIIAGELKTKRVAPDQVKPEMLTNAGDLVGRYTFVPLNGGEPVLASQVGKASDPRLLKNTLVVELAAGKFTFAGPVEPGDVVSASTVSATPTGNAAELILSEVLVLNVSGSATPSVVLAVPLAEWPKFQTKSANATVNLARLVK
jgi:Flp pilus assembly protein CpaB